MPSLPFTANSTPESVLDYLRDAGTSRQLERVCKSGIPASKVFGTSKSVLREAAKAIGKNERLAEALWDADIHEARLLAILIADPQEITYTTLKRWSNDLWSWGMTDQLARYLLPYVTNPEKLLAHCAGSNLIFTKRLTFAGIACLVQKNENVTDAQFEDYCDYIRHGADDNRHHVRKAVVWALIELGKVSESMQEAAIVFAAELVEVDGNPAWVGRNALKELELLVRVPERRRLLSRKSKTGRKA